MCTRCHGHSLYYQATVFALTFIVAMATVVIGDTCSKYHGHTHYYQATMLVIVINCLRLFVIVTMAMGFTLYSALSDLSLGLHMILTAGPRTFRSSPTCTTTTCETHQVLLFGRWNTLPVQRKPLATPTYGRAHAHWRIFREKSPVNLAPSIPLRMRKPPGI